MIPHVTPEGGIHMALALLCIGIGAIQFMRPKRGASHRARGYAFVYAMLVVDGTALLLYRFTGAFNMFHVGALVNLVCIVAAIAPMLRTQRPPGWKYRHYYFIAWSYVGLLSAAINEPIVRLLPLAGRAQAWTVSAVVTVLVSAIGYILIERYRPPPGALARDGAIVAREGIAS
jgi:uncharacterized membrane protein